MKTVAAKVTNRMELIIAREVLCLRRVFSVHSYTVTTFGWDLRKAASNVRKHGIHFADAVLVLEDDRAITFGEETPDEERWVTIGMDAFARILVVVHTLRGNSIRIISARPATTAEESHYLENT
jgi:uncharacterized protein